MRGIVIITIGVSMVILAVILFMMSIVYRKTVGKKIREELTKEYGV